MKTEGFEDRGVGYVRQEGFGEEPSSWGGGIELALGEVSLLANEAIEVLGYLDGFAEFIELGEGGLYGDVVNEDLERDGWAL